MKNFQTHTKMLLTDSTEYSSWEIRHELLESCLREMPTVTDSITESAKSKQPILSLCMLSVLLLLNNFSQAATADDFVDLPQELEIELALSALPEALQADATVYVRDPKKGFIVHRRGTNGWVTFVVRTSVRFYEADWAYSYPPDQIIPQAHDEIGQKHHVIPYFDVEKMRIDGVPPKKVKAILKQRFSDGTYTAPSKGGSSYMLAPIHRAYMEPAKSSLLGTVSFPHYMPYAPYVKPSQYATMDPHMRSGVLDHGGDNSGPHGYFYFMVQPDQADAIRVKYANLLKQLCTLHANWCIPDSKMSQPK